MYDLATNYLDRLPNVPYSDRHDVLQALASLQMDAMTWAAGHRSASPEDLIPDETTRRIVLSRLPDPEQYQHTLSELFCWGLARGQGWSAELVEQEAYPDLRVVAPSQTVYAEVKTISVGSAPRRVDKIIEKANRQIKSAQSERSGLLYIIVQREGGRARLDDRVPNDVAPYVTAAAKKLASNSCRSVGAITFLWDELRVTTGRMLIFAWARTSRTLRHDHPRSTIAAELLPDSVGITVAHGIFVPKLPPSLQIDPFNTVAANVTASDFLREVNELRSGLLPVHIAEIYREPDSRTESTISSELTATLVARQVRRLHVDSVVLLVGTIFRGKPHVFNVLQLFGSPDQLAQWRYDPYSAFWQALSEYGIPVRVGEEVSLLFEHVTSTGAGLESMDSYPEQTICAVARWRTGPFGDLVEYVMAHAIDVGAYRSVVEAAYLGENPGSW
jgi:hypothetical protein